MTKPEQAITQMSHSKLSRVLATVLSSVTLIASLVGLWGVAFVAGTPIWGAMGFMAIASVACVIGVFLGLGKPLQGFGLGMLVVGGTVLVAAGFAWLDAGPNLTGTSLGGRPLKLFTLLEALLAVLLVATGAFDVLLRSRRSVSLAVKACVTFALLGAVGAGVKLGSGMLFASQQGAMEILRLTALFVVVVVGLVLISAGGHFAIRAFEAAAEDTEPQPDA